MDAESVKIIDHINNRFLKNSSTYVLRLNILHQHFDDNFKRFLAAAATDDRVEYLFVENSPSHNFLLTPSKDGSLKIEDVLVRHPSVFSKILFRLTDINQLIDTLSFRELFKGKGTLFNFCLAKQFNRKPKEIVVFQNNKVVAFHELIFNMPFLIEFPVKIFLEEDFSFTFETDKNLYDSSFSSFLRKSLRIRTTLNSFMFKPVLNKFVDKIVGSTPLTRIAPYLSLELSFYDYMKALLRNWYANFNNSETESPNSETIINNLQATPEELMRLGYFSFNTKVVDGLNDIDDYDTFRTLKSSANENVVSLFTKKYKYSFFILENPPTNCVELCEAYLRSGEIINNAFVKHQLKISVQDGKMKRPKIKSRSRWEDDEGEGVETAPSCEDVCCLNFFSPSKEITFFSSNKKYSCFVLEINFLNLLSPLKFNELINLNKDELENKIMKLSDSPKHRLVVHKNFVVQKLDFFYPSFLSSYDGFKLSLVRKRLQEKKTPENVPFAPFQQIERRQKQKHPPAFHTAFFDIETRLDNCWEAVDDNTFKSKIQIPLILSFFCPDLNELITFESEFPFNFNDYENINNDYLNRVKDLCGEKVKGLLEFLSLPLKIKKELKTHEKKILHNNVCQKLFVNLCTHQFIKYLWKKESQGVYFNIYGHNASGFDNVFILQALLDLHDNYWQFKFPVVKGTKIIKLFLSENGFTTFKCTFQFLTFSLNKLCKEFKIENEKKNEIKLPDGNVLSSQEFVTMKKTYTPWGFLNYLKDENIFKHYVDYCETDVIALSQVWTKFKNNNLNIIDKILTEIDYETFVRRIQPFLRKETPFDVDLLKAKHKEFLSNKFDEAVTAPSWALTLFKFCLIHDDCPLYFKIFPSHPLYNTKNALLSFNEKIWETFEKTIIGGISHCNDPDIYLEDVYALDVVSLYPSAMLSESLFPLDDFKITGDTNYRMDRPFHLPGAVYCKIEKPTNVPDGNFFNVPKSRKNVSYDWRWGDDESEIRWINTEDANNLFRSGFDLTVYETCLSHSPVRAKKIFDFYIKFFKKEKMEQDGLKEERSALYNNSYRNTLKLMLNSLFGKMMEKNPITENVRISPFSEVGSCNLKIKKEDGRNVPYAEKKTIKKTSPIFWGSFILSTSRSTMFKFYDVLGRENVIHTETDSIYCRKKDFEKIRSSLGKDFGELNLEEKAPLSIFVTKKIYSLYFFDDGAPLPPLIFDTEGTVKKEDLKNFLLKASRQKIVWKGIPKKLITPQNYVDVFDRRACEFKMLLTKRHIKPYDYCSVEFDEDYVRKVGVPGVRPSRLV